MKEALDRIGEHLEELVLPPLPKSSGSLFAPCSGRDIALAILLGQEMVDKFTFCDLSYGRRDTSAVGSVPEEWRLLSKETRRDAPQSPKNSAYLNGREIVPALTTEVWRRANGSEVTIELRKDQAQDVLQQQIAPHSISIFMHLNDGVGEGGSGLAFLREQDDERNGVVGLLGDLAPRLADGAIIVTDGTLCDARFCRDDDFHLMNISWRPLASPTSVRSRRGPIRLWMALGAADSE